MNCYLILTHGLFCTFNIVGDLTLLSTQSGCIGRIDFHTWFFVLVKVFKSVAYVENAKMFGSLFPFLMPFAPLSDLRKFDDHVRISAEKVRQRLMASDSPDRLGI